VRPYVDAGDGAHDPAHASNSKAGRMIVGICTSLNRGRTVPGQRVFEQVIVSNADLVLPVFSVANPTPKWGLRIYLVSAEAAGCLPL
jgi:hypothetical protein